MNWEENTVVTEWQAAYGSEGGCYSKRKSRLE